MIRVKWVRTTLIAKTENLKPGLLFRAGFTGTKKAVGLDCLF
jgi:hypothetical protein